MVQHHEPLTSLTASAEIPSGVASNLFGKSVTDLQTGVTIGTDSITGTLKYVSDYTGWSPGNVSEQSGNYLALYFDVPGVEGVTYTAELTNGIKGPVTLDSDQTVVFRIDNKDTHKVKITATKQGLGSVTKVYSLSGLTLNNS